jgi:hypothetical protein
VTLPAGPREVRLTGDLVSWEVFLVGGGTVHLAAHAFSQEKDEYVFVALADGTPPYEVGLARIPVKLVARIIGG